MKWMLGILILLLVTLQYRLWVGEGSLAQIWSLKQEIALQKNENQHLSERNNELEAEVLDLKQGIAAIEELARMDLGMIKEGETFIWLIEGNE